MNQGTKHTVLPQDESPQDDMAAALLRSSDYFCPVSMGKTMSRSLWIVMVVSLIAAVIINARFNSPALLGLYAVPIIIFSVFVLNRYFVIAFSVIVLALCLMYSKAEWWAMAGAAGLFVIALLVQRVVSVSRNNFLQKAEYEELFMNTILSFSKSIDARDPYTSFHSKNVAGYAKKIAIELGLPKQQIEAVYLAGLIHDIGKIGTPESILHKEGRLTEEEFEIMKSHAEEGYQIVKNIKRLQQLGVTEMVRHHHERMDGRGYPLGLKGKDIPIGARILTVSDSFDAMTTNRSYRQKLSVDTAAAELRRHSGTQFDPDAAQAMLKVLEAEGKLTERAEAWDEQKAASLTAAKLG